MLQHLSFVLLNNNFHCFNNRRLKTRYWKQLPCQHLHYSHHCNLCVTHQSPHEGQQVHTSTSHLYIDINLILILLVKSLLNPFTARENNMHLPREYIVKSGGTLESLYILHIICPTMVIVICCKLVDNWILHLTMYHSVGRKLQ